MNFIESFLSQYTSIIATISSIGTVAAVIVALWLAHMQRYSKVSAYVSIGKTNLEVNLDTDIAFKAENYKRVLSVSITNYGPYSIYINLVGAFNVKFSFFGVLLDKTALVYLPLYPSFKDKLELEITPGKSLTLILKDQLEQIESEHKKASLYKKTRSNFLKFIVFTSGGQKIKAKISKQAKKFLIKDTSLN